MFRIVTDEGKELLKSENYAGCENYWNSCNGIYEDENGEHHIYIEEVCNKPIPCCGCPKMDTCTAKKLN